MTHSFACPLAFAFAVLGVALAACSPEARDFTSAAGAGGNASSPGVTNAAAVGATGSGAVGATSGSGVGASSGTGMTEPAYECATDADCVQAKCVEVTPGGFRVCVKPPLEATACTGSTLDLCCLSIDCEPGTGKCYLTPPTCGPGPTVPPHNDCLLDQCKTDIDCTNTGSMGICVLPGVLEHPVRSCVFARCRLNTDCTEEPDGICAPVVSPCCGSISSSTMACIYPSNACRSHSDCKDGQYCLIEGNRAGCVSTPPSCPK